MAAAQSLCRPLSYSDMKLNKTLHLENDFD